MQPPVCARRASNASWLYISLERRSSSASRRRGSRVYYYRRVREGLSASRHCISCGQCSTMARYRECSRTVRPLVRASGAGAPRGRASVRARRVSRVGRPYVSYGHRGTGPACRWWSRTAQSSVRARRASKANRLFTTGLVSITAGVRWKASRMVQPAAPVVLLQCWGSRPSSFQGAGRCEAEPVRGAG